MEVKSEERRVKNPKEVKSEELKIGGRRESQQKGEESKGSEEWRVKNPLVFVAI